MPRWFAYLMLPKKETPRCLADLLIWCYRKKETPCCLADLLIWCYQKKRDPMMPCWFADMMLPNKKRPHDASLIRWIDAYAKIDTQWILADSLFWFLPKNRYPMMPPKARPPWCLADSLIRFFSKKKGGHDPSLTRWFDPTPKARPPWCLADSLIRFFSKKKGAMIPRWLADSILLQKQDPLDASRIHHHRPWHCELKSQPPQSHNLFQLIYITGIVFASLRLEEGAKGWLDDQVCTFIVVCCARIWASNSEGLTFNFVR